MSTSSLRGRRTIAKSKSGQILPWKLKKEPQRNHGNDVFFSSLRRSVVVQNSCFSGWMRTLQSSCAWPDIACIGIQNAIDSIHGHRLRGRSEAVTCMLSLIPTGLLKVSFSMQVLLKKFQTNNHRLNDDECASDRNALPAGLLQWGNASTGQPLACRDAAAAYVPKRLYRLFRFSGLVLSDPCCSSTIVRIPELNRRYVLMNYSNLSSMQNTLAKRSMSIRSPFRTGPFINSCRTIAQPCPEPYLPFRSRC